MKTTQQIACYHCRFFAPGTWGCSTEVLHEELGKFDAYNIGQCRKNIPRKGITLGCDHDVPAKWPRVYAGDWCGQFERRTVSKCDNGCPFKPFCSPKIKEMCQNQKPETN